MYLLEKMKELFSEAEQSMVKIGYSEHDDVTFTQNSRYLFVLLRDFFFQNYFC